MFRVTLALVVGALCAGGAAAADRYEYRFEAGKPLTYRTNLESAGSFALPDGTPKTIKLAAQSVVKLVPEAPAEGGWKIASQTVRAKTSLDGRETPPPKGVDAKRTMVVRADGAVTGGDESTFAIVFPGGALAKGDRFTAERKAVGEGLPLKTTYTLVDTSASLAGHAGKLSLFEARSELTRSPAGRTLALKRGGGKVWFDLAAGMLVKTELAYEFNEQMALPGGGKAGARSTTVRFVSELVR